MSATTDDSARVARFLHARRAFVPRGDDVWVVSYPRSGTTWTLFLVHLLRTRGAAGSEPLADVAPWFERELALGQKTPTDLEKLPSPRLFKSHLPFVCMPHKGRLLYVERDGRDVALSYFHLYRSYLGYEDDFDAFFERFLDGDLQYGSWLAHTRAWREAADDDERALYLSYEELSGDLPAQVRRMSDFLALPLAPDDVARVVEQGSFESMKRQEERFDFARVASRESRRLEERRFLRRGRVGDGSARLSSSQSAAYDAWLTRSPAPFEEARDLARFLH